MIRIESISQFVEQISCKGKFDFFESNGVKKHFVRYYRGHSDNNYELLPSIARQNHSGKSNLNYERKMIARAQLRNPAELSNIDNRINLIAKLQHYGLETRFLDVTENALVALYFACINNPDSDGEVIIFSVESDMVQRPDTLLSKFYIMFTDMESNIHFYDNLFERFYSENTDFLAMGSLITQNEYKNILKLSIQGTINSPIFIQHAIHSEREIRQQAAFMMFTNKFSDQENAFQPEILPLSKNNNLISDIILIPKEYKSKLLEDLSLLGITDEYLFPEFSNRCKSINQNIRAIYPDNTEYSVEFVKSIVARYSNTKTKDI